MNKHVTAAIALLAAPAAVLAACADPSADDESATTTTTTTTAEADPAPVLTAQLSSADGSAVAQASIDFTDGFATVTVETVEGSTLSPGFHALHLHEFGRCEGADFVSAGGHFQAPGSTGQPASGDLPPLLVRSDGAGKLVATTDAFTEEELTGPNGSSILLHEGADMPGSTEGADTRIACAVISPAGDEAPQITTTVVTETVVPSPAPGVETSPPASPTPTPEGETTTTTPTVTETTSPTTTTETSPATSPAPAG
ncbi:superoxide dismutase family protein [Mycobacterium sp. SMC-4]|uniref:superoxide dismutase family protein n=1 Tax=Mycobacterium sp. SMC-4 TaxID=2857059 RepID=UPI0021B23D74|nr:superoxide dismutase family protein [Mycobacterium sp. SMC-4]UXA16992.1 superoxide dismutase family protein [Mycobacterium sp. SMC-4]